jgi:hypothetical protein
MNLDKLILDLLENLKTGDCFCPVGIGHPLFSSHTKICVRLTKLLEETKNENSHNS